MIAVSYPSWAARTAAVYPPGPAPRTTTSKCSLMVAIMPRTTRRGRHPGHGRDVSRSAGPPGRPAERISRSGRVQHDDGDVAVGLGPVVVERGPHGGHRGPQLGLLLGARGAGDGVEPLGAHLHRDVRVGDEILVPARVVRRAALGGHDDVRIPVGLVDQRELARLA